jgi:hypothetical protein
MGDLFKKIRRVVNEEKVDSSLISPFGEVRAPFKSLFKRFEMIIRLSGFSKSYKKVNSIGHSKMMAYYSDAEEAKKFEKWAKKQFQNTKLNVIYKDLDVNDSKAGIIFDFTRM